MTQKEAFEIMTSGYNVYLTGPAGSGKTFLLNKYIAYLKDHGVDAGVTASTGIAATHIGGLTIHSWSGFGIKDKLDKQDIDNLLLKPYLQRRFMETQVLIIDEISMLHATHLDLVDKICKAFKSNNLPFGGIQIILCGDFFQLPPVSKNGEKSDFVDKSKVWQEMDIKICYLDEQHRHQDERFLLLLNQIRDNNVSSESIRLLMSRLNKLIGGNIPATRLYTHNIDVDAINNFELQKIKEPSKEYEMTSWGEQTLVDILKKGCLAPEKLVLKKGAVVMFVKNNFDKGYVNGTVGKVIGFDESNLPIIETVSKMKVTATPTSWTIEGKDRVKAEISQIPLRLAWAITVHKSQGMSLDLAEIDLSKSFLPGMGYVALSRVRTLNGIKLMGLNKLALEVEPEVIKADIKLREASETVKYLLKSLHKKEKPQVKFLQLLTQTQSTLYGVRKYIISKLKE